MFESLKNGYIDDLELAVVEGGAKVLVRSSSRVGFLDFGVNAKRLNFLSSKLRALLSGIPMASHCGLPWPPF